MFKRGISPLIATVLIIGFTVALGSVIMTWGSGFISSLQKGSETSAAKSETCAATAIELTKSEQDTPNTINFLLENLGNTEVEAFTVRVTGEDGIDSFEVNQRLGLTTKKQFHVNFDSAKTGIVTNIEVIPRVSVSGNTEDCTPGSSFAAESPSQEDITLWETKIGNRVIDPWEECDTSANPQFPEDINGAGQTLNCASFGFPGGSLTCTPEGLIDTTSCTGETTCGNGVLDTSEQCDLVNGVPTFFGSVTDCATYGTSLEDSAPWTGQLYCSNDCMIDSTQCTNSLANCGNGAIDQYEECDGTELGTETCTTKGLGLGTLSCLDNCKYDTSNCVPQLCGNGVIDNTEQCDGTDLGGQTCWAQGFHAGQISCSAGCTFNTNGCVNFVEVASGASHTCAITQSNDLYCWGENANGQLGLGDTTERLRPTKVSALPSVTQVETGNGHTCAIANNQLYCWGYNGLGQLGIGVATQYETTPKLISLTNPTSISLNRYMTTCAIANNQLYCWGYNLYGNIGDGTTANKYSPTLVSLANPTLVEAGNQQTCAINTANEMYCWGRNTYGEIGDGTQVASYTPKKNLMTNPVKIATGYRHTCATNTANEMYCWGYNLYGGIGDGTTTLSATPKKNLMTNPGTLIDAGDDYTCATNTANQLYCWGWNWRGNLGNGVAGNKYVPTKLIQISNIQKIDTGPWHACAITSLGFYCWGDNRFGQLGKGNKGDLSQLPVWINQLG